MKQKITAFAITFVRENVEPLRALTVCIFVVCSLMQAQYRYWAMSIVLFCVAAMTVWNSPVVWAEKITTQESITRIILITTAILVMISKS